MDPLHATIEEFAAEGFAHVECYRLKAIIAPSIPIYEQLFAEANRSHAAVKECPGEREMITRGFVSPFAPKVSPRLD